MLLTVDHFAIARAGVHATNQDGQTQQTDGAVLEVVVAMGFANESAQADDSNRSGASERKAEFLRDHVDTAGDGVLPDQAHRLVHDRDRDVKGDDADGDCQPEKERNDPVLGIGSTRSVFDQANNPPGCEENPYAGVQNWAELFVEFPTSRCRLFRLFAGARFRGWRHAALLHVDHDVVSLAPALVGAVSSFFVVEMIRTVRLRLDHVFGVVRRLSSGIGILLGAQVVVRVRLSCRVARGSVCHCHCRVVWLSSSSKVNSARGSWQGRSVVQNI
jgi:hypothetical protein